MGEKKLKYREEEDVAYPAVEKEKEFADYKPVFHVPEDVDLPHDVSHGQLKQEPEPIVHSFVVKQLDEFVKLQVITSTLDGQKYIVIPHRYFNTKTEEIIMLDDSALVPFNDGYSKNQ